MRHTKELCRLHGTRLVPQKDLRVEWEQLTVLRCIRACFLLRAVCSLLRLTLWLANQKDTHVMEGHFENVSRTGSLRPDGLHLPMGGDEGRITSGGHIVEVRLFFTTLELVFGEAVGLPAFPPRDRLPRHFQKLSLRGAERGAPPQGLWLPL